MEHLAIYLLPEISRFAAMAFVSGLWQGLALIAAVTICLRLLPGVSAAVRFAAWAGAFVLLATVPLLHDRPATMSQPGAASPVLHIGADWGFAIAGIWAALIILRTGQLLIQTIRLRRIWRNARPVADGEVSAVLRNARRNATLCISADVDAPSVIGFFKPRLLIPDWMFARLSEAELRQVVLHECEHLRRRDDWMNLAQKIALALFPLNPALLWMDRRLGLERELACDAGVVASIAAPYDYAHCLTRLAEHRMVRRRIGLALSAWSRQSELAHRVYTLLRPMRRMSTAHARISIALVGLGLAGLSFEMARAPHFISFEYPASTPALQQSARIAPISSSAYARPADYREATPAHPKLMLASLHRANTPKHFSGGTRISKVATQAAKHTLQPMEPRPHAVLVAARQVATTSTLHPVRRRAVRPVYAVAVRFSPTYAAVPFGNGWLLIRL
jgi:beta-lactamase regulating signal transducer with metallopeptidase domain